MADLSSRGSFFSVVQLFWFNGFAMGAYAGSLATIQARAQLAPWQLSTMFVVTGIGAIAAMQTGGRLADRLGARPVALAAVVPQLLAPLAVAAAGGFEWLLPACLLFGLGNGGLDISMNALAIHVEKARPRPVMSFFHGMWSVGNLMGAGLTVATAFLTGWDPVATMTFVLVAAGAAGIAVLASALALTPQTPPVVHTTETGQKAPLPRMAYLLGLMAIAFGLGEGTATDWSGIHVKAVTGVDSSTAALGVTAMTACMVVIRILGDRLVARFGRRAVVRAGGVVAVAGYLTTALATPLPLVLVGWGLVGAGMAVVAPQVYSVAGHLAGGRGLAVVVTFGYATFLAAPAAVGAVVTAVGVQHTMFLPACLLVGLVVLARVLPRPEDDPAGRLAR